MIILLIIIAISSFYSLQDPLISPDIHKDIMEFADERAWSHAENIVYLISLADKCYAGQRISISLDAMTLRAMPAIWYTSRKFNEGKRKIFIVNLNRTQLIWRIGARELFYAEAIFKLLKQPCSHLVINDGMYYTYYITSD